MKESNGMNYCICNKKGGSIKMIRDELEELREELYKSINNGICLCNENVVKISERLDKLIIEQYES